MSDKLPKPPRTYDEFSETFPMNQVVAIAASIIGMPSAVAVWT
jgi:hypothetical protein